jgi:hypothetical protein
MTALLDALRSSTAWSSAAWEELWGAHRKRRAFVMGATLHQGSHQRRGELAIFAPAVLIAYVLNISTPATKVAVVVYSSPACFISWSIRPEFPQRAHSLFHGRLAGPDRHHRQHPAVDLKTMARPIRALFASLARPKVSARSIAETFARAGHDVLGLSRTNRSEHLKRRVEQSGASTPISAAILRSRRGRSGLQPHAGRIDVWLHNPLCWRSSHSSRRPRAEFEQAWRVACPGDAGRPVCTAAYDRAAKAPLS